MARSPAAAAPPATAATLLLLAAAGGAGAADLDDASSLVQRALKAEGRGVLETGHFDCSAHPELCQPPFNCQLYSPSSAAIRAVEGVKAADLGLWCEHPEYGLYASQCLAKHDPISAAMIQFKLSKAGIFGKDTFENDGSYCFLEGLCVDTEVTVNTTLEEAEGLCDKRFGPRWRSWGGPMLPPQDHIGFAPSPKDTHNGLTSRAHSTPFLIAACAMGNYHCDVMYCRTTYCQEPYFQQKYGHLLVENGWLKK